jgi:hypothetical protein
LQSGAATAPSSPTMSRPMAGMVFVHGDTYLLGTRHERAALHKVPDKRPAATCRAGLYKQLSGLKSMLAEVRDDASAVGPLKEPIAASLEATGTSAVQR